MTTAILLAGCIIQDSQKRILLLHRSDPQKQQWETPGGKLEPGEDPKIAAVREISEKKSKFRS
jgi:8-oxo-dGTP diphosphatase